MSKTSSRLKAFLGATLIVSVGLAMHYRTKARDARDAFALLDSRFDVETTAYPIVNEGNLFRILLESPYGAEYLRELASKYPSIEFHESRNAVYYLHERDGSSRRCIGTVYGNDDEGNLSGHCAIMGQYRALTLTLDGEQLSLACRVSTEERYELYLDRWGLVPDQDLTGRINLKEHRGKSVKFVDFGFPGSP